MVQGPEYDPLTPWVNVALEGAVGERGTAEGTMSKLYVGFEGEGFARDVDF
jgi:hypothetical protein